MTTPQPAPQPTIADHINNDEDIVVLFKQAINQLNDACVRHRHSPRDAGVVNPGKIADNPIKLKSLGLEDSEIGVITVTSGGVEITAHFSADETISDFINYTLLEALPA